METIAIVRLSALGDIVNTLPVLKPLRRAFPDSRLCWIVEEETAELLSCQELDVVIAMPRKRWQRSASQLSRLPAVLAEVRTLRNVLQHHGVTISLDFQGNLRSGVVSRLTGAPLRIGYARSASREGNWLFNNRRITVPETSVHRVERHLSLLRGLGIEPVFEKPELRLPEETREWARRWARTLRRPVVAIHPGTSTFGSYKRWGSEKYQELARRLVADGVSVVLTWGPGEREEAERIAAAGGTLAPETPTVSALAAILAETQLTIGADTGPIHLASVLGIPVVVLFGPKDPRIYAPYFSETRVIELDLPCRPCKKRRCNNPRCILDIPVDPVYSAARELLAGS